VFLHPFLPPSHRNEPTHSVVRLGVGIVVTVTALVLGLLTYSVKTNFDQTETNVRAYAASLIVLEQSLRAYGPDAAPARDMLREYTVKALRTTWPEEFGGDRTPIVVEDPRLGDVLSRIQNIIWSFEPADSFHRVAAAECVRNIGDAVRRRFTLIEQMRHSIPPVLLGAVIVWMAFIFLSFGLNAPRNPVVLATLALCAVAISSTIYLVDELDTPVNGIIKISSQPLRDVLKHELR
jgi:hypothetical protein